LDSPRKIKVISDGVAFSSVQDGRFKTNRISVNLIVPLARETVTLNALLPQVLRRGFAGCPDVTALNQRLQELYGASIDADVQKRGDFQILTIAITAIDDSFALHGEAIAEQIAEIACDMTLHPLEENGGFNAKYVEIEKHALCDTIEAEINEKRSYAVNGLIKEMCPGEPYGLPKYGFLQDVAAITPEGALRHYRELLRTARIEILFTGRGSADGAISVFEEAFASQERAYTPFPGSLAHQTGGEVKRRTERMPVNQSKLVLGFGNGMGPLEPGVPAARLMAAILGGIPSSKLFLHLREELSLCYYCMSRYDAYKGLLIVDSGVESKNVERAEKEILVQLAALQNGELTDEELFHAKLDLENAYSTVYESDITIESFYLGQLLSGLSSTPEAEREKLSALTKEDVIAAARAMRLDAVYLLTGKEEGENV